MVVITLVTTINIEPFITVNNHSYFTLPFNCEFWSMLYRSYFFPKGHHLFWAPSRSFHKTWGFVKEFPVLGDVCFPRIIMVHSFIIRIYQVTENLIVYDYIGTGNHLSPSYFHLKSTNNILFSLIKNNRLLS